MRRRIEEADKVGEVDLSRSGRFTARGPLAGWMRRRIEGADKVGERNPFLL
jgi:hypothetical protein